MMKTRLRFLLLIALSALLFMACAGNDAVVDGTADESVPLVEASAAPDADESAETAPLNAEAALPILQEQPEEKPADEAAAADEAEPAVQAASTDEAGAAAELFPETSSILGELSADYLENEFIPFEEEKEYMLDVAGYYDGFSISEDDFVAVESEPVPVPDFIEEPVMPQTLVPEEASLPETAVADAVPADEDEPLVMEPVRVPAPREDMKKPVVIVTEEAAASTAEKEKEVALAELENILSAIPEPEEIPSPVPSRSIIIHKNDVIEVPYQGNWWVYLGDENSSGALVFSGRDYIADKTVFTLRAVREGVALLHFYKQDIIGGVLVDDYLAVTVEEAAVASEKVELDMFIISQIKPEVPEEDETESDGDAVQAVNESTAVEQTAQDIRYAEVKNEALPARNTAQAQSAGKTDGAVQNALIMDEEDIVSSAESVVMEEEPAEPVLTDRELFEKAQALEASDIEGALEAYKTLVANFPLSPYWSQANKRITYINRFYFFKR